MSINKTHTFVAICIITILYIIVLSWVTCYMADRYTKVYFSEWLNYYNRNFIFIILSVLLIDIILIIVAFFNREKFNFTLALIVVCFFINFFVAKKSVLINFESPGNRLIESSESLLKDINNYSLKATEKKDIENAVKLMQNKDAIVADIFVAKAILAKVEARQFYDNVIFSDDFQERINQADQADQADKKQ